MEEKKENILGGRGFIDFFIGDLYPNINLCEDTPLDLFGLSFVYNLKEERYQLTKKYYDLKELIWIVDNFFKELQSVNDKGYITDSALSGRFMIVIQQNLLKLGYEFKELGNSETTYTLWFNFMFVNLYLIVLEKIQELEGINALTTLDQDSKSELSDLLDDLLFCKNLLLSRLDPYLKHQLHLRGITFIQNTYTGFDTEYELQNQQKNLNKLVSVQTAIQRRTIIKVPLYHPFDISYVHPLTSELSNVYKNKVDLHDKFKHTFYNAFDNKDDSKKPLNELKILNNCLKFSVTKIRRMLFSVEDEINSGIIKELKDVKSIDWFEDLKHDQLVFILPLTPQTTKFMLPCDGLYSMQDLLNSSTEIDSEIAVGGNFGGNFGESLRGDFISFINLLSKLGLTSDIVRLINWLGLSSKPRTRTKITFKNGVKISISVVKNNYIMAHYNTADLSMLSDFDVLKDKLSIVGKSFVTLGKPLKFEHTFVYVRDTMLLAPAGKGSLSNLGKMYLAEGDFAKRSLKIEDLNAMGAFLKRDPRAFEDYAIQDAIITLKHGLAMEKFNLGIKQLGIPLTLSSIGRNYVFEEWAKIFDKHLPYQISGECLMGNVNEMQTPKGLFATRDIGVHMSYFIANYKGGRNESFMYGSDTNTQWFDYDLVSAYTTGMAELTLPDYYAGSLINPKDLEKWEDSNFLDGYLIVNCDFEFHPDVKYPSIPCFVDNTTTVYPIKGSAYLTGPEYLLAKKQGCDFNFKSAFYIHSKEKFNIGKNKSEVIKPFHRIIRDIQKLRRGFPKDTINNLLYKEMGNSIYGNVVRGISNKKSFDSLTGKMFRVTGTPLSNPVLASWTTAFIRSVIGECLHNIHKLGGRIVSVTTDGFITDIENLESRLIKELPEVDTLLLRKFKTIRFELANNNEALELKSCGKGIMSWTTRGQMGVEGKMIATTGFQREGYTKSELISEFRKILATNKKYFEFTRKSLRSAKDIFLSGGHVTTKLKDQIFRLFFDNRRKIIEPLDWKCEDFDLSDSLFDSKPLQSIEQCKTLRFLSKFPIVTPYNKNSSMKSPSEYKSKIEVGVRNFIKGYFSLNEKFGLVGNEFKNVKELITFISGDKSTQGIKISRHSISKLKNRKMIWRPVPQSEENLRFCNYILKHYPYFRSDLFLKQG